MNCKISFQERAVLATDQLYRQLPITLEQAKEQVLWLRKNTKTKQNKRSSETYKICTKKSFFYDKIDEKKYISEGAEQKIYIKDEEFVLKLNDAIYYAS